MIQTDTRRDRAPMGISIAIGVVGVIAGGLIAGALPAADPGWRFGVIAIAVAAFAAISLDQRALGAVALIAFGVQNGFLEDQFGQLSWHGSEDLWRALLLVVAGACGLALGEAYRLALEVRRDRRTRKAVLRGAPAVVRQASAPTRPPAPPADRTGHGIPI